VKVGTALVALLLAWVLPGDRVIEQVAKQREDLTPLRVEAALDGDGGFGFGRWPERVVIDLHPTYGFRVSDDRGGRWVIRDGAVVASTERGVPRWVPDLGPLLLRGEQDLERWLVRAGVNAQLNELGRCGAQDCFVLGGREADAQLWLEKDRFEVRRWQLPRRRWVELSAWQDWGEVRFPPEVRIGQGSSAFARLTVTGVTPAPELESADFSSAWVDRIPPGPDRGPAR
jgi:hypothetical protein